MTSERDIVHMDVFTAAAFDTQDNKSTASEQKMLGPYLAMQSVSILFRGMLLRQHLVLQSAEFDPFVQALGACRIGFVKEALALSTSASVGCAQVCFDQPNQNGVGLVFNFGTGGGKVTAFQQVDDVLEVIFDIKPRDVAPSPNDLQLGAYVPKKAKNPQDDLEHFEKFCKEVDAELKKRNLVATWAYAFVTGPSREFFYDSARDATQQREMDDAIANYMKPIATRWALNPTDFFLKQEVEAEFENKACEALYKALSTSPAIEPMQVVPGTSCGIGRGSCQALLGLMAPIGMNKLEAGELPASWMFDAMVAHLQTEDGRTARDTFVRNVAAIQKDGLLPVIPCKSGFALLTADKKWGKDVVHHAFSTAANMIVRCGEKKRNALARVDRRLSKLQSAIWELEQDDQHENTTTTNIHFGCVD